MAGLIRSLVLSVAVAVALVPVGSTAASAAQEERAAASAQQVANQWIKAANGKRKRAAAPLMIGTEPWEFAMYHRKWDKVRFKVRQNCSRESYWDDGRLPKHKRSCDLVFVWPDGDRGEVGNVTLRKKNGSWKVDGFWVYD